MVGGNGGWQWWVAMVGGNGGCGDGDLQSGAGHGATVTRSFWGGAVLGRGCHPLTCEMLLGWADIEPGLGLVD
jgi:hypothetical protein